MSDQLGLDYITSILNLTCYYYRHHLMPCLLDHLIDWHLPLSFQAEVDEVLGSSDTPTMQQYQALKYNMRCFNESMRLYPHPPVLLRRALVPDELPGGYQVAKGQDVMISVYNIHHSPQV